MLATVGSAYTPNHDADHDLVAILVESATWNCNDIGVHTGVHTVWGRCAHSMAEVYIQYGGGVHAVWGRCAYSMGEVCIQYRGGVHAVWGGVHTV